MAAEQTSKHPPILNPVGLPRARALLFFSLLPSPQAHQWIIDKTFLALLDFQAAIAPDTKAEWTQLEYTVPELVREGDCVQVTRPWQPCKM